MKVQFFGPDESLLGVHHVPRKMKPGRAILICPPLGQEYLRTHWTLRLLANQLSRRGMHVLRFDWSGFGDSQLGPEEIRSLERWRSDMDAAIDYLKKLANASSVALLGLRFGAGMAAEIGCHREDVNGIVAWEPVLNGREMLQDWRSMHRRMLDLWHCRMTTVDHAELEEMVGWIYQRTLINELEAWQVDLPQVDLPQLVVEPEESDRQFAHPMAGLQKWIKTADQPSWSDLSVLETAWLRPETNRILVTQCNELFDRLERRGLLQSGFGNTIKNTANLIQETV